MGGQTHHLFPTYRRRQDRTFVPKPIFGDGSGHAFLTVWKEGSPLFYDGRADGLSTSPAGTSGGILEHASDPSRSAGVIPTTGWCQLRAPVEADLAPCGPAAGGSDLGPTPRPSASVSATPRPKPITWPSRGDPVGRPWTASETRQTASANPDGDLYRLPPEST